MSKYGLSNLTGESEVYKEFLRIYGSEEEKQDEKPKATPSNDLAKAKKESENLFDIETKTNESNKFILEQAHPETVEVAESYHQNGGVVEDLIKVQEIAVDIANRMPNGRISNKAIASKELIDELIVVAEEMDIRGHNDIAIFADNTAQKIHKKAFAWDVVGIVAATLIPTLVGAYYGIAHLADPINMNIRQNIDSLQLAVNEYKESKSQLLTNSTLADQLDNLIVLLNKFDRYRTNFLEHTSKLAGYLPKPKNKSEVKDLTVETVKELQAATNSDTNSVRTAKIAKALNDMNEKYAAVSRKFINELNARKTSLATQFKSLEDLSNDSSPGRSNYEKVKGMFSKWIGGTQQSSETQILESISDVIKFINTDIAARNAEKAEIIRQVSSTESFDDEFVAPKIEGLEEDIATSKPKV